MAGDPSVDAREQRWTLRFRVDRYRITAPSVVFASGPQLPEGTDLDVVPASRLAEADEALAEARDQTERWADSWRAACDRELRLQEALETIEQIASVEAGEQVRETRLREALRAIRRTAAAARASDEGAKT